MEHRQKYFIQQYLQENYNHGGVGPVHAERILLENGYKPLFFPKHHSISFASKLSRLAYLLQVYFSIKKGAEIVFLFPVYARMNNMLIRWLAKKKGIRCVCYIADIDGIKDAEEDLLREEKNFLRMFSHFIVHNAKMDNWVRENILREAQIAKIEFFDFIVKARPRNSNLSREIVFAGNLGKSGFLKNLPLVITAQPDLSFHLYGPGMFEMDETYQQIVYHGQFSPDDLPRKLEGSFGLVWDGESVERPSGILGHYLQFITHHKLSLYILAGLPIIIPSSAGSAQLVQHYGIGIVVDSLFDISAKIGCISDEQYLSMKKNMQPLAEKISNGKCLLNALDTFSK